MTGTESPHFMTRKRRKSFAPSELPAVLTRAIEGRNAEAAAHVASIVLLRGSQRLVVSSARHHACQFDPAELPHDVLTEQCGDVGRSVQHVGDVRRNIEEDESPTGAASHEEPTRSAVIATPVDPLQNLHARMFTSPPHLCAFREITASRSKRTRIHGHAHSRDSFAGHMNAIQSRWLRAGAFA